MTEHVLMEAKSGYALFSVPSICVTISTIVQYRNINIVSIRSREIKILRQRMIRQHRTRMSAIVFDGRSRRGSRRDMDHRRRTADQSQWYGWI